MATIHRAAPTRLRKCVMNFKEAKWPIGASGTQLGSAPGRDPRPSTPCTPVRPCLRDQWDCLQGLVSGLALPRQAHNLRPKLAGRPFSVLEPQRVCVLDRGESRRLPPTALSKQPRRFQPVGGFRVLVLDDAQPEADE
jgi:hypothetical protein